MNFNNFQTLPNPPNLGGIAKGSGGGGPTPNSPPHVYLGAGTSPSVDFRSGLSVGRPGRGTAARCRGGFHPRSVSCL